jgi:hypothetical protein
MVVLPDSRIVTILSVFMVHKTPEELAGFTHFEVRSL